MDVVPNFLASGQWLTADKGTSGAPFDVRIGIAGQGNRRVLH